MTRYWASWWTGYYASEGCTKPPYQIWNTGERDRESRETGDEISLCAVIDANNDQEITDSISKHFPDYEIRFIKSVGDDWIPGDRFPDFENKTSLAEAK
jgi:hypothetical protein